jgi:alpha/beta superfamily hydrolase
MEKKVYFYSGGLKLAGVIELPDEKKGNGTTPGIILCHAGTGTKEVLLPEVSQWLVRKGYVVLRFDYRGVG